jgi:hypothetical protein
MPRRIDVDVRVATLVKLPTWLEPEHALEHHDSGDNGHLAEAIHS